MMAADQPVRYNSKRMARSRCLFLVMDLRKAVGPHRRQGYSATCFGNRGHYHPQTGACVHVEQTYARLRTDWHRDRFWYLPFGDRSNALRRFKGVVTG